MSKYKKLKILFLDVETAGIEAITWSLREEYIPLGRVRQHTTMLSWAAGWRGSSKIIYKDQSRKRNRRNDRELLIELAKLIEQADVIVGHALKRFDRKKIWYRLIANSHKVIDIPVEICTLQSSRKLFGFDSHKLEHLCEVMKVKNKKRKHSAFPGNELFDQCLAGNQKAWKEMKKYNPVDVLALKEIFEKLLKWDKGMQKKLDKLLEKKERECE